MIGEEGFGGNVLEVASVGGRLPLAGADGFSQIRLLKNGRYSPITFLYFSSCTSITIYYKIKPNSSTSDKNKKEYKIQNQEPLG